ncbi:hypothetical protein CsSME_00017531 [Camellia sinensis var. sinensis]
MIIIAANSLSSQMAIFATVLTLNQLSLSPKIPKISKNSMKISPISEKMDSFNIANLKFEKPNATMRYPRVQNITTLLRFIEIFFFLLMISQLSTQFPLSALKLTGDYFRRLTIAVFSPWFVFVIGNAIIITLFLKDSTRNSKTSFDFCEEYVENSLKNQIDHGVEIEYRRRKSQYENLKRESGEERYGGVRRRSAAAVSSCAEKMSGEEFRRTMEDFIARQQRYLREEEFSAIVRY